MKNKIMISVIVLIVLAGGFWYMQSEGTKPALVPETENMPAQNNGANADAPVATGKVDDLLASVDSEGSQEPDMTLAGDADAETALSDEGVISDLNQSYDETTL